MSIGADEETVRLKVGDLATVISNYRQAARHAKKMKPKAAKSKAAPSVVPAAQMTLCQPGAPMLDFSSYSAGMLKLSFNRCHIGWELHFVKSMSNRAGIKILSAGQLHATSCSRGM